jgi:hypothetical protein
VEDVWLAHALPVDVHLPVHDLDAVAGHSDDPFNVNRVILIRERKDD